MIRVSFLNAVAFCNSDGPDLELDTARRWHARHSHTALASRAALVLPSAGVLSTRSPLSSSCVPRHRRCGASPQRRGMSESSPKGALRARRNGVERGRDGDCVLVRGHDVGGVADLAAQVGSEVASAEIVWRPPQRLPERAGASSPAALSRSIRASVATWPPSLIQRSTASLSCSHSSCDFMIATSLRALRRGPDPPSSLSLWAGHAAGPPRGRRRRCAPCPRRSRRA
jgi:hypothetical protein